MSSKLSDVTYISIERVDLTRLQWLSLARLFTVTSPIFPSDSRDIARLTVNGGHLDFQMYLGGGRRGSRMATRNE